MRKKNPWCLYPKTLREKIRLPRSIQPPKPPSLLDLSESRLLEYAAAWGTYKGKRQIFIGEVFWERLDILRRHYSVSSDADLLIEVLMDLVPGFQVDTARRGQKTKWGEPLLVKLAVEVGHLRNQLDGNHSDIEIMRRLGRSGFFKGINPDVLQNQHMRAKKMPLKRLAKWLRTTGKDQRLEFIEAIERAARDQL